MGILVNQDYTTRIDRTQNPAAWARALASYVSLCAASGHHARSGNLRFAIYLGENAKAIFARLW